jgi:hypothetical protein
LLCLFMVPYRTNSYASLFILYFVHGVSLLGTDHTNCAWQWIDRYIHFTRSIAFLSSSKKEWWVPEDHQPLPPTLSTGHHKLLFSLWDCRGKPPRAFSKQEWRALGWGGRLASYPTQMGHLTPDPILKCSIAMGFLLHSKAPGEGRW